MGDGEAAYRAQGGQVEAVPAFAVAAVAGCAEDQRPVRVDPGRLQVAAGVGQARAEGDPFGDGRVAGRGDPDRGGGRRAGLELDLLVAAVHGGALVGEPPQGVPGQIRQSLDDSGLVPSLERSERIVGLLDPGGGGEHGDEHVVRLHQVFRGGGGDDAGVPVGEVGGDPAAPRFGRVAQEPLDRVVPRRGGRPSEQPSGAGRLQALHRGERFGVGDGHGLFPFWQRLPCSRHRPRAAVATRSR